jgi:hypothetical protein
MRILNTLLVLTMSLSSLAQVGLYTQLGADIDGEAAGDYSGHSVSLSADGTILAIGADGNDGNGTSSGHVRVYELSNSSWSQLGADINGEAADDLSGWSVSLSDDGTIVAIGAYLNDGNGASAGHVRVYGYSSGSWSQLGADIDGEVAYDKSGEAVSLSGDGTIVAIGAKNNAGNGSWSGHVRVYGYSSGAWSQLGADIDGEVVGDYSGYSVSLSSDGTTVAIGAPYNDGNGSNSGHVRVYGYSNSSWSQLGSDINGEAVDDYSGRSVSLSDDGTIVAIGATNNSGNGTWSGHVRVYGYSNGIWSQLGADIDGEAAGDYSGHSVSLSADGTIVAIGAGSNNGNGTSSGHVRVYGSISAITFSNGNLGFCSGDTIQASVPNLTGRSYLWSTGDTTNSIDIYQGGNYSVIISSAGGWVDTVHTIANEIALPATQIAGSPNTTPSSTETYATSQNTGNTYSWYVTGGAMISGQGTNVISVLWSTGASGVVAVTESLDSSSGGCSASDTLNVSISGVGIEEVNSLSSMLLKPNPNNGHFSLGVDQRQMGSTYRIVDFLGRTIETGTITKPSQDFDLSDKPKGVYRIQVSNEKASKTLNVVIQ